MPLQIYMAVHTPNLSCLYFIDIKWERNISVNSLYTGTGIFIPKLIINVLPPTTDNGNCESAIPVYNSIFIALSFTISA
jgi:hypothetical protein